MIGMCENLRRSLEIQRFARRFIFILIRRIVDHRRVQIRNGLIGHGVRSCVQCIFIGQPLIPRIKNLIRCVRLTFGSRRACFRHRAQESRRFAEKNNFVYSCKLISPSPPLASASLVSFARETTIRILNKKEGEGGRDSGNTGNVWNAFSVLKFALTRKGLA